ncbi:unnamed protein product [Symbiodinium natans]|uniref:Uncharacterized protein n=1 Tax=Symbiodinium natans TaxID=878477 RepID=A0A812UB61_9DINO|nr:unnamed protein product [Symbiodinium natans]
MGSGGSVEVEAPPVPPVSKMQKLPANRKAEKDEKDDKAEAKQLPERRSDLVVGATAAMQKPPSNYKRLQEGRSDPATPKIQKPEARQEGAKADIRRLIDRRSSPPVATAQTSLKAETERFEIKRLAERRSNPWEVIPQKLQKPQASRNVETTDNNERLPQRWCVPPLETIARMQKPQTVSEGEKASIRQFLERGSSQHQQPNTVPTQNMQKPTQASFRGDNYEIRPLPERWSDAPGDAMPDMPLSQATFRRERVRRLPERLSDARVDTMPMPDMPDVPMLQATFRGERAEIRQLREERLWEERPLNVKRSFNLRAVRCNCGC